MSLFALSAHARSTNLPTERAAFANVVPGLPVVPKRIKSLRDLRFENIVRQENDFSCGASAIATLLQQLYGLPISEHEVITEMLKGADENLVRKHGFSMLDMKNYVDRIGLRGSGYQLDKNGLSALKVPVIALQTSRGYAHFVVIKRVHHGVVYLADPALGHRQMPLEEFAQDWNGIVLAIVGIGLKTQNALLEFGTSFSAPQRAAVVTRTLPPQQEFGMAGPGSF